jgi:hypothetical protein
MWTMLHHWVGLLVELFDLLVHDGRNQQAGGKGAGGKGEKPHKKNGVSLVPSFASRF